MVDVLRKHVAPQYRVLVDGKAFLNTTINDGVLYFTAGQIELMRNLMQYANRRTTWVSDYYIGYYLSPTDEDWDLIQQEVADLEDTLMGNNNVIWGYADRYAEALEEFDLPAGVSDILCAEVPEGEVWEITGMVLVMNSLTCNQIRVGFFADTVRVFVNGFAAPTSNVHYPFSMDVILKEGDRMFGRFYNMTLNDDGHVFVWGSKMEVPA